MHAGALAYVSYVEARGLTKEPGRILVPRLEAEGQKAKNVPLKKRWCGSPQLVVRKLQPPVSSLYVGFPLLKEKRKKGSWGWRSQKREVSSPTESN